MIIFYLTLKTNKENYSMKRYNFNKYFIIMLLIGGLSINFGLADTKKKTEIKTLKSSKEIENKDTITNYSPEKKLILELMTHNLYLNYVNLNMLRNNFNININNDAVSQEIINSLSDLNLNLDKYYDWMSRFKPLKNSEIKTIEEINNLIKQTKEVVELQKGYVKSKNTFEKKKLDKVFAEYKKSILDFFGKYKDVK